MPAWLDPGALMGHGNRWYKVRVRPQYGLMSRVGVPCFVNPGNALEIWIDWDAAYKEHVPAWEQEARLRREVAKRDGRYDQVVDRIVNPFAGKLRPGEETLADEKIATDPSRAKPLPQTPNEESAEHKRRMDELARIHKTGRKTRGIVVACSATSRTLATIPVFELDLRGRGPPRRLRARLRPDAPAALPTGPRGRHLDRPGRPQRHLSREMTPGAPPDRCGRRDSNPHALRHRLLRPACLPIPPRPRA